MNIIESNHFSSIKTNSIQLARVKHLSNDNEVNVKETNKNDISDVRKAPNNLNEVACPNLFKVSELSIKKDEIAKNIVNAETQDSIFDCKKILNYKIFNSRRKDSSVLAIAKLWDKRGESNEIGVSSNKA